MELHLALRNIVKTDGPTIITEGRLVNILCDFQAFDTIPASKYVMRAIIDDGYSRKLLQCSRWDVTAEQLSSQFAASTGFQPNIVWTIFQSLAYGLGWLNTIISAENTASIPPMPSYPKQVIKLGKNPTISDVRRYFSSLIERIPETEKALGVEFSNISCGDYSPYEGCFYFDCNLEVRGIIKESRLIIKVVTYSTENKILNIQATSISKSDLKGFGVYSVCSQLKDLKPSDIGRIIVYAE